MSDMQWEILHDFVDTVQEEKIKHVIADFQAFHSKFMDQHR